MFKMRCRVCGSTHTKKNGVRKGVQLYKCQPDFVIAYPKNPH